MEVRYEDVVAEPRRHIKSIVDFIGLPWSDEFEREFAAYPFDGGRVQGFRRDLDPGSLMQLETAIGSTLRKYGYDLSPEPASTMARTAPGDRPRRSLHAGPRRSSPQNCEVHLFSRVGGLVPIVFASRLGPRAPARRGAPRPGRRELPSMPPPVPPRCRSEQPPARARRPPITSRWGGMSLATSGSRYEAASSRVSGRPSSLDGRTNSAALVYSSWSRSPWAGPTIEHAVIASREQPPGPERIDR